jgi:hypothetical protein
MLFHGDSKNKIVKKLNTLFISLKRKFINTASYYVCYLESMVQLHANFSLVLPNKYPIKILFTSNLMSKIVNKILKIMKNLLKIATNYHSMNNLPTTINKKIANNHSNYLHPTTTK